MEELAGFFNVKNFAALVTAALRASAMRQLPLMAMRTLRKSKSGQRVMRTPLGGAGLGVTPLWIRHF
jgi:hypothetical protein